MSKDYLNNVMIGKNEQGRFTHSMNGIFFSCLFNGANYSEQIHSLEPHSMGHIIFPVKIIFRYLKVRFSIVRFSGTLIVFDRKDDVALCFIYEYRKTSNRSRDFYSFFAIFSAAYNRRRLLIEGGL